MNASETPTSAASGPVTGLVLAGGRGSRMGGRDKGLVQFRGRPMLEHVLAALRPQVDEVLISANRHLDWYRSHGPRVVPDRAQRFEGPLAGIAAGLREAHTPGVVVVPCDGPFVPPDLVRRLRGASEAAGGSVIAAAHDGERLQPTFAFLPASVAGALDAYLAAGHRKVAGFYAATGYVAADFSDCPEAFVNVNTPDDVARAEAAADGTKNGSDA